jgi:hypothetical protein
MHHTAAPYVPCNTHRHTQTTGTSAYQFLTSGKVTGPGRSSSQTQGPLSTQLLEHSPCCATGTFRETAAAAARVGVRLLQQQQLSP